MSDILLTGSMSIDGVVSSVTGKVPRLDPVNVPLLKPMRDFTPKGYGVLLPLVFDGKGTEIVTMLDNTSTMASKVPVPTPTLPNPTNPFYLAWVGPTAGGARVKGVIHKNYLIDGTPQGHLYGGIMFSYLDSPLISGLFGTGIPGSSGEPPGETFTINIWNCINALLDGCGVDGEMISSSPIGLNGSINTLIRNTTCKRNKFGIGVTFWKSDGTLENVNLQGCRRPVNMEVPSGKVVLNGVDFRNQLTTQPQVTCHTDGRTGMPASVEVVIVDPIGWDFATMGPIRVGCKQKVDAYGKTGDGLYGTKPNTQDPNMVSLKIGSKTYQGPLADPKFLRVGNVY